MLHNYGACDLGLGSHNCWAYYMLQLLKPTLPKAHAPQQERPQQWDVCALHLESSPYLLQLEKSPHSNEDPAQKKNNT